MYRDSVAAAAATFFASHFPEAISKEVVGRDGGRPLLLCDLNTPALHFRARAAGRKKIIASVGETSAGYVYRRENLRKICALFPRIICRS